MSKISRAEYFNTQMEDLEESINERYGMGEGSFAVKEAETLQLGKPASPMHDFPMGQTLYTGPMPTV